MKVYELIVLLTGSACVGDRQVVGDDGPARGQLVTLVLIPAVRLVITSRSNNEPLVWVFVADTDAAVVGVVRRATLRATGARVGAVGGFGDEQSVTFTAIQGNDVEETGVRDRNGYKRKRNTSAKFQKSFQISSFVCIEALFIALLLKMITNYAQKSLEHQRFILPGQYST